MYSYINNSLSNSKVYLSLIFFGVINIILLNYFYENNLRFFSGLFLFVSSIILLLFISLLEYNKKNLNLTFLFFSVFFTFYVSIQTIINGKSNIEFYSVNLISSINYLNNLFNGKIITWFDGRSLGAPSPLVNDIIINPFLILGIFSSLKLFYISLWFSHIFIGVFYFIKLNFLFSKNSKLSIFSGYLFIISSPLINYFIINDWTHTFITFTILPVVLYYLFVKIINFERNFYKDIYITLIIFYYFYNSNISFNICLVFIFLIFTFLCLFLKLDFKFYKNLNFIFISVLILLLPRIYYLLTQLFFLISDEQSVSKIDFINNYNISSLIDNLYPFFFYNGNSDIVNLPLKNLISLKINSIFEFIIFRLTSINYDALYIGPIFFFITFSSIFLIFKEKKIQKKKVILLIYILNFICLSLYCFNFINHNLIQNYYFGVLFIILSLILSTYFFSNINIYKNLFITLYILQISHFTLYSIYGIYFKPISSYNYTFSTNFYDTKQIKTSFSSFITNKNFDKDKKIILSPIIEKDLQKEKAHFKSLGIYSIQDIYVMINKSVLNDNSLQGIKYPLSISNTNKMTSVSSNYKILENKKLLDFLDVDLIILKNDELKRFNSNLYKIILEIDFNKVNLSNTKFSLEDKFKNGFILSNEKSVEKWIVLKNINSWNLSKLKNDQITNQEKNLCTKNNNYCKDNFQFLDSLEKLEGTILGKDGKYNIKIDQINKPSIIVLNKPFSSNWKAHAINNSIETHNFYGFLSLKVPPLIKEIKLTYSNNYIIVLTFCLIFYFIFINFYYFVFEKNFYKTRKF